MVKYCKINDPDKGTIPFEAWGHLIELLQLFGLYPLIIILKARQLGITWLIAMYALWKAIFFEGANVIILSRGESEASETLDYCKFVHKNLPDFLRLTKGNDRMSLLSFPIMNSRIRALPATQEAGIGFGGATLIILDEWDFHPYAEQNYSEIKPMIDAGGSRQLIILSARNRLNGDSKFVRVFNQAEAGENSFHSVFLPYNLLDYRTNEWYETQKRDYDPWELETRYPKTKEEALSPSKAYCRFDYESLKLMLEQDSRDPIETRYNGEIKIFKYPIAGGKYCFAIDSSEGEYDPSCGILCDWQTGEGVAEYHGKISVDQQALYAWELFQMYHRPFTAVERNADGRRLIDKMIEMGVNNWYYTAKGKPGWWTHGQNRPIMIGNMAEAIRLRAIRNYNRDSYIEFFNFVKTDKKPEGIATKGAHDDYVIAWCILLQIRRSMPVGLGKVVSFSLKDTF